MLFAAVLPNVSATAQERRIRRSELPPAVQKTADDQAKGAEVRGYTTEVEGGQREYEVETVANGHSRDVTISPTGAVLEVEEQVQLENLPAKVRTALQNRANGGEITKVESLTKHGRLVAYEAQVRTKGRRKEVQVGPDGGALAHPE
jgi:uncharacterized membrane protein YkoI